MHDSPSPRIASLLRSRQPNHTLPAELYTDANVFDADMEVIFHRHWIYVGPICDVPEPGDVSVVDIGRSSIIILRDDADVVRAFFNVCRHRGARLLPAGISTIGRLVCPYHQWTYELSGELAHAMHMGKDFDASCHSLVPVHLRSIGGLLYACLADRPPADLDDLAEVMEARLAPYGLRDAKVAHQVDLIERGNWKLTIENNRECYHCSATHPELCVAFVDLDFGFDPASLSAEDRALAEAHEMRYAGKAREWEALGFETKAVEHLAGHPTNFRTQRLVMGGAGESQTADALAACGRLLGSMTRKDLGDLHLWGHNAWHHFMGDHAVTTMVMPLSASETLIRTKWLVHKEAVEGADYDVDRLTHVWKATNEQDAHLVAIAHAGIGSRGYRPGTYSRFTEGQLDNFLTWDIQRMQAHGF